MTSSFDLGRVAGIEIGAHWTWLAVVVLIIRSLAEGAFPRFDPRLSETTYDAMGTVAALGLFASITLHELGHARPGRA